MLYQLHWLCSIDDTVICVLIRTWKEVVMVYFKVIPVFA
jgi:hypothetical protein